MIRFVRRVTENDQSNAESRHARNCKSVHRRRRMKRDSHKGTQRMKTTPAPLKDHKVTSSKEWLEARNELLQKEKELTRLRDEVSEERRKLPWLKVEKNYVFDAPGGGKTLADLFEGRSQLLVKHFMFGPGWKEGCVGCSFEADHIEGA